MPPEVPSKIDSLEKLSKVMELDPSSVSVDMINQVFEMEEKMEEGRIQVKEGFQTVEDSSIRKLREMRDRMILQLETLRNAHVSERSRIMMETRLELAKNRIRTDIELKRHDVRGAGYEKAEKMAEEIDDYEGVDALHNKTRDTLTGYLAAIIEIDHARAKLDLDKCKLAYEKSDKGSLIADRVLTYDSMVESLGLGKYMADLEKFDLTDDTKGLLLGYLSLSEKILHGKEQEDYKNFLLDGLIESQSTGKLAPESYLEKNKRPEQRKTMENYMSPVEWKEMTDQLADERARMLYGDLKNGVSELLKMLPGFSILDKGLQDLLKKSPSEIKASDEGAVNEGVSILRKTLQDYISSKTSDLKRMLDTAQNFILEYGGEGSLLAIISGTMINTIKDLLKKGESLLAGIVIGDDDPMSVLIMNAKKLKDTVGIVDELKTKATKPGGSAE